MFKKLASRSLAVVCGATILAASSMGIMNVAHAEYVGPSKIRQYNNVAEILKSPVDDTRVTLRGKVIMQLSEKMYQFSDGTGVINAKIGPKEFDGVNVDANTPVEIWGKIHEDSMKKDLHIDVRRLNVVR